MGISGQSACKLLHDNGACVSFYDDENRFAGNFAFEKDPLLKKYDYVIVSPGIKVRGNPLISHFLVSRTPVLSELDLGYLFTKGNVLAVTGTNGKTTVTSLLGKIFETAGKQTFVCGTIGLPLSTIVDKTDKKSFVVCEVSNFQLELSSRFKADEVALLNIAPDHIDRHGSMEEYLRVKKKILTGKQILIVIKNLEPLVIR